MITARSPAKLNAVLCDLDGLLVDTERVYLDATISALVALGYPPSGDFCRSMTGHSADICDRMLLRHFGPLFPLVDFLAAYEKEKRERLAGGVPLRPGAASLVRNLVSVGVQLGVVSSSGRETVEHYLAVTGLLDPFRVIVSRDDVARPKPAPDPYELAVSLIRVPRRSVVVLEDSPTGASSALGAGLPVGLVPDLVAPTPELRGACMFVVHDLIEAWQELKGQLAVR